jgi:hypothetical protein
MTCWNVVCDDGYTKHVTITSNMESPLAQQMNHLHTTDMHKSISIYHMELLSDHAVAD